MGITFNYIITHLIEKESDKKITNTIISKACFDLKDESTQLLARSIHTAFGNESNRPDIGKFKDPNNRGTFAASCCKYANSEILFTVDEVDETKKKERNFIELTSIFAKNLKAKLESISKSIGGYITCLHYTYNNEDYLLFAIIREEDKVQFFFNEGREKLKIKIKKTSIPDVRKLRLAFKISIPFLKESEEQEESKEYLFIVAAKEADKTDYFADLIGYTKSLNSKKSTETLFKFINDKFNTIKALKKELPKIKDETATFLKDKESVSLDELQTFFLTSYGNHIEDEDERNTFFSSLANEMASDDYKMPQNFAPNHNIAEKSTFTRIKNDHYTIQLKNSYIDTEDDTAEIYYNLKTGYINVRIEVTEDIKKLLPENLKSRDSSETSD